MSDSQKLVPRLNKMTGLGGVVTTVGGALAVMSLPLYGVPVAVVGVTIIGCSLRKKTPQPITWKNNQKVQWKEGLTLENSGIQMPTRTVGDGALTFTPGLTAPLEISPKKGYDVEVQAAETFWYYAASKTIKLIVTKVSVTISWKKLAEIDYGTPLAKKHYATATSTAEGEMKYSLDGKDGILLDAKTHDIRVEFKPNDGVHYESGKEDNRLKVNPVKPTVAWPKDAIEIDYKVAENRTIPAVVTASFQGKEVKGTLQGPKGNAVATQFSIGQMDVDDHDIKVKFIPDSGNFLEVDGVVKLKIKKVTPVVVWNPAPLTHGSAPTGAQQNATLSFEGKTVACAAVYVFAGVGDVMAAGSNYQMTVTLTPTDTKNFNTPLAFVKQVPVVLSALQKANGGITGGIEGKLLHGTVNVGGDLKGAHSRDVLVPGVFTNAVVHIRPNGVNTYTITKNGSNPKDSTLPPLGWTNEQFLQATIVAWNTGAGTEVQDPVNNRYSRTAFVNGIEWKVVRDPTRTSVVAAYPTGN